MAIQSVRLTNAIRDNIKQAIENKYEEQHPKPETSEEQFGDYCYKTAYGDIDVSHLPKTLFNWCTTIKVNAAGERHNYRMSKERPVAHDRSWEIIEATVTADDKKLIKLQKEQQNIETWYEQKREFLKEVNELLRLVNTSKQLLELWPEVEPYLPPHIADPSRAVQLPAIPISRLNERLGIKDV